MFSLINIVFILQWKYHEVHCIFLLQLVMTVTIYNLTSTLKNFNKNYKRLGTTEKEETRGDTDGTIILFLIP